MSLSTPTFARRQTTSEAVAAQLRYEIQRGILAPGCRLRQGEVATRFGVSTTPVREAFQLLQAEGLVRTDPHRGTEVFQPTAAEVREAYEIRKVLEAMAIEKAMPNITDELVAELDSILDQMSKVKDEREWLELNHSFHFRQYEASGWPKLCSILANIRDASSGYMYMVIFEARKSGRSEIDHRQILDAIKARDVPRAQKAIVDHLHQTVEQVVKSLETAEDDGAPATDA